MKKRRQHYVWQSYLRSWVRNDKIACLREGKIFSPSVIGIGHQRDFYRLRELSEAEVEFLTAVINLNSNHEMRQTNNKVLQMFTGVFELRRHAENQGISDHSLQARLDIMQNNLEEDFHARIESDSARFITSILNGDMGFYANDEACADFIYFLIIQYCRTKRMLQSVIKNTDGLGLVRIQNIWGALRHIIAINVSNGIYSQRQSFRLVRLTANDSQELITGDQPVINIHATNSQRELSSDEFELYYPVSPHVAILLSKESRWDGVAEYRLNSHQVRTYNDHIVSQAHEQLYASSEKWLHPYLEV